jgi:hypothetical protein
MRILGGFILLESIPTAPLPKGMRNPVGFLFIGVSYETGRTDRKGNYSKKLNSSKYRHRLP